MKLSRGPIVNDVVEFAANCLKLLECFCNRLDTEAQRNTLLEAIEIALLLLEYSSLNCSLLFRNESMRLYTSGVS